MSRLYLAAAAFFVTTAAIAQPWPTRPIRLVVATTAGGSPDTIARMVGRAAEPATGQRLVIDNRGGENGIIAAQTELKRYAQSLHEATVEMQ